MELFIRNVFSTLHIYVMLGMLWFWTLPWGVQMCIAGPSLGPAAVWEGMSSQGRACNWKSASWGSPPALALALSKALQVPQKTCLLAGFCETQSASWWSKSTLRFSSSPMGRVRWEICVKSLAQCTVSPLLLSFSMSSEKQKRWSFCL